MNAAWFELTDENNNDPIKQNIRKKLDSIETCVTVSVSENLDYKFYNYIGGQLIESKIRTNLNLQDSKILDGIYNEDGNDYYIELKSFMGKNRQSGIRKMFTRKEIKTIKENLNSYIIIYMYKQDHHLKKDEKINVLNYNLIDKHVLTRDDFLNSLEILDKKRKKK